MLKAARPEDHAPAIRARRPGRWPLAAGGLFLGAAWAGPALIGGPAPQTSPAAPVHLAIAPAPAARSAEVEVIAHAKRIVADCRDRYARIRDYTCSFIKSEQLDCGRTTPRYVMTMKARVEPESFYFKFRGPKKAGREAIFVAGNHGGRALVHDVGLGKLLAGTLELDPHGSRAMEDCRHPITDAGLGHLITTIAERWEAEMSPGETRVTIQPDASAAGRPCTMIQSTHTEHRPDFLFHTVRVYVDREHILPIRFEAFAWPRHPTAPPELVEDYTFQDLRLDVGLSDHDFDPGNRAYSFGRF